MPAPGGNGLAMRAGLFLQAVAGEFEVTLLVVPVLGRVAAGTLSAFVASRAARTLVLPLDGRADPPFQLISCLRDPAARTAAQRAYPQPLLCRFGTSDTIRAATALVGGTPFDVVHVMRVYLAPFAGPHLERRDATGLPVCGLDLDDDESRTRLTLARLHALRGDGPGATLETSEARKYDAFERRWLPRFDVVFVCSETDGAALRARLDLATARVVPNAVAVPESATGSSASRRDTLQLLFVGSLAYLPNEDAALFLCHEVLPRLQALTNREVRVQIVGTHPPPAVARLGEIPGVAVASGPPSLAPFYAAADVVAVPVRAGGGTRIKVLEAFSYGVPVVSSPVGVEGLEVESGIHLLVAADAAAFAEACLRLRDDTAVRRRLAEQARALVASRYAVSRVARAIQARYRGLLGRPRA